MVVSTQLNKFSLNDLFLFVATEKSPSKDKATTSSTGDKPRGPRDNRRTGSGPPNERNERSSENRPPRQQFRGRSGRLPSRENQDGQQG